MGLTQWVAAFRALHERAKRGELGAAEMEEYRAGREALARAMVSAQGLTRKPDQSPREALRVARVVQVSLESRVRLERLATAELSVGGFSARMARAPGPDEELTARLRLPGGDPVVATVRIAGVKPQQGFVHVSFSFVRLEAAAVERLEQAIFDVVLAEIRT
jgi:hypothetical protein